MNERYLIKNIIEFSFLIKAQLYSEETALLRSALSLVIMEAEDILEAMENPVDLSQNDALDTAVNHRNEA
jgi:hypothetical protein